MILVMQKSVKHRCSNAVSDIFERCLSFSPHSLAAHYIDQVVQIRDNMKDEVEALQREKDQLQQKISQYQTSLPVDGIPVVPANRRSREASNALFHSYVADRTRKNWRFYPYSLILKRAFDSFQNNVTCESPDEFMRSLNEWKNNSLGLAQLRQSASQTVMEMGRLTSFITGKKSAHHQNKTIDFLNFST